jgi:hypothetical protein
MNTEIESIFKNFEVDSVKIPIAFIKYRGKEKTYITYHEIDHIPELEADDKLLYSSSVFDFDVYTDGNYLNIVSKIKEKMSENDFVWIEDSPDMFEEDTRLYHKTITFAKERSVL